jgi:hypothetical protein
MNTVFILLTLSALIGFALGKSFSWPAAAAASIGIALLSSVTLQIQGFGAVSGIATVVTCLTLSQIAYLGGGWTRHKHLFDKRADEEPRGRRDDDVGHKRQGQQRPISVRLNGHRSARCLSDAPATGSVENHPCEQAPLLGASRGGPSPG